MNQALPPSSGHLAGPDRFTQTTEEGEETAGFKISLSDMRTMLWRQRQVLIAVTVVGLLLAVVATFLMTPIYRAAASVKIDNESVKILEGQDLDPVVSLADTGRYLNTQKAIVESRALATNVVDALKLDRNDQFIERMGGKAPDAELPAPARQAARRETVIGMLTGNVGMTVSNDSRIGLIEFSSRDPVLAASIANSYTENYIAANVKSRYETNAYARKVLSNQVDQAQVALQQTEREAIDYARRYRLIDTGDASTGSDDGKTSGSKDSGSARSVTTANLVNANRAYVEARAHRIEAESRWRAASASNGYELPEGISNPSIAALMTQRAEQSARLGELRARYQDNHPEVREAQTRLQETERQLGSIGRSIKNSIYADYRAAVSQEQQLAGFKEELADDTLTEQDRRVRLNLIARDAETQRRQLNDLLTRLNQVNSAADITANNISLIDKALVPGRPVSPNFTKNLLYAAVVSLALAFLLAMMREALDDTLRTPEDAERKLHLPLLGTTPYIPDISSRDAEERQSELSEAYYSIRATVDYASSGAVHKVFLVTSSQPGEGKSTTAIAIARDFARIGRKVLLVDGDLRNPSMHRSFQLSRDKGLIDVLMRTSTFEDCVQVGDIETLHLLPLGPIPPNPVQILSSGLIQEFLAERRPDYDVIIIDSAPVMGLADAPMLARMADHVLLLVEANRAHFGQAKAAVRRLQDSGGAILGIIMSKFSFRDAGYNYDYHYTYYSYRSKQGDEPQGA